MGVGIGRMLSLGVVKEALGDQMTDDNKGNQTTMMRGDKDDNNKNTMNTLQRQNDNDMIANNNQM